MSRWKYPFNSMKDAEKHLKQAEKQTGKTCFVRQVSIKAYIFKIFSSESEYEEYQKQKRRKNEHQ